LESTQQANKPFSFPEKDPGTSFFMPRVFQNTLTPFAMSHADPSTATCAVNAAGGSVG